VDGLVLGSSEFHFGNEMEGDHQLTPRVKITSYSVEGGDKRHLMKFSSLFLFIRVVRPGFAGGDALDLLNFGEDELKSPMILVAVA
jgi:hypothetical protein